VASSAAIRGQARVVSFTAAGLWSLAELRVFRPHRRRWDFEPYGICLRRDWLTARGARPVIYGDDETWQSLAPCERPYFQRRATRTAGRRGTIHWPVEKEWRHVGDLDLSSLAPGQLACFVPTRQAALRLATVTRWPVFVLPQRAKPQMEHG
jgi:hypothetical protein